MDIRDFYIREGEKPLDRLALDGGFCGIFRTIGCIGDSLSSGEFEGILEDGKKLYYDAYDYSWGQVIGRMSGSKVYNFSHGGMSAKQFYEEAAPKFDWFDPEKACQAYIFALGVNDMSQVNAGQIEFGELSDICENEDDCPKTVIGYYTRIIHKYKKISPHAKFFLMNMPRCAGYDKPRLPYVDKLTEALYKMAEIFENIYVLDVRKYGPEYDSDFNRMFYLLGHLNPMGYIFTAKMVASYIDYIIRANPEDFKQIGFVCSKHEKSILGD